MNICFVSNLYGENARGGAERVVQAEAEALAGQGHEITVIAGEAGRGGPRETVSSSGVKVIRYHPPNLFFYADTGRHSYVGRLFWHLLDTFNLASARRLADIVRRVKPDVVHSHNLMGLGFMVPAAVRRLGIRHVHTLHDVQLLHPSGLLTDASLRRPGPAAAIHIALTRRLFGSPAAVISPSRFLLEQHSDRGFFPASARTVLPNPAPPAVSGRPAPAGPPVFLFAGQLEEHKGIRFLLDVWSDWPGRDRAVLEIAGGGSLESEVRERISGAADVRLLGRLSGEELRQAYDRAAYTVLPSLVIENSPTVIGESYSRGTPVIAASSGGMPELVTEGQSGLLFPTGDRRGLLTALDRAADLSAWPARSAGAVRAAAGMSIQRHCAELLNIYEGG